MAVALGWVIASAAQAQAGSPSLDEALSAQVRDMILEKVALPAPVRVDVELGRLNPRLRLAPCQRVEPFLPMGMRLWGSARIGLRCALGPTPWTVYLPVTVNVHGPGLVAKAPMPAGHVLTPTDLREAEVILSASRSAAVVDAQAVVGRVLAQPLAVGQDLRENTMKSRQWFSAGDTVQVRAVGGGFAISGSGQAISAGVEGQTARIRTESGKIINGMPVGTRMVEITL